MHYDSFLVGEHWPIFALLPLYFSLMFGFSLSIWHLYDQKQLLDHPHLLKICLYKRFSLVDSGIPR